MKHNYGTRVGSEAQYDPRTAGEILQNNQENSNETLANTDLAVDLKTILRSDHIMKTGKEYYGVLRRDSEKEVDEFLYRDPHYTFVEMVLPTAGKRNPHVFVGKYITVTRRDDGTLRPNFKPMKVDKDFSLEKYAIGVGNELIMALEGLIEKM